MQENISHKTKNRQLFSERFRKLRKDLRLSQRELSNLLGLSGNTQVSKFEKGTSEPTIETLRRLERLSTASFAIDIHKLVTGKPCPSLCILQEEKQKLLELLAKYISRETGRLLDERQCITAELAIETDKVNKDIVGSDEMVNHLKSELHTIEQQIADVAEDQHWIAEALKELIGKSY